MTAIGPTGAPLTLAEAQRLTSGARAMLAAIADQAEDVAAMIREARDRGADVALGYPSWTAYVAAEFADLVPRLDTAERSTLAAALGDLGMSSRAVAAVTGTSQSTAARDMTGASGPTGDTHGTHGNREGESSVTHVTGLDGKTYPARRRPTMREAEEFGERVPPRKPPLHLTEKYARAVDRVRQALDALDRIAAEDESGAIRRADRENSARLIGYGHRLTELARGAP